MCYFHTSIIKYFLLKALSFRNSFTDISDIDLNILMNAWNSLILHDNYLSLNPISKNIFLCDYV